MHELVTFISGHIRESMNQEEGVLCLSFIKHIIAKSTTLDTIEKLW